MNILCVIDSLGSGGAQRQIVNLAIGLRERGHHVDVLTYSVGSDFFRPQLTAAGVRLHQLNKETGFSWKVLRDLVRIIGVGQYDALISFLPAPNIYTSLAAAISGFRGQLIVGERSSYVQDTTWKSRWLYRLPHLLASVVVANSRSQGEWLRSLWLIRSKVKVIYNGYQLPQIKMNELHSAGEPVSFLIVGRISPEKNGLRLIQALCKFHERLGYVPYVSWAGRQEEDPRSRAERREMDRLLEANPAVHEQWKWLGERKDVIELMRESAALLHLSLFEGLPNAVCEAFTVGCPVIASNVCDHPFLVDEERRGLLCDPTSVESICDALQKFVALSPLQRLSMQREARAYAEQQLTVQRMASDYESLLPNAPRLQGRCSQDSHPRCL